MQDNENPLTRTITQEEFDEIDALFGGRKYVKPARTPDPALAAAQAEVARYKSSIESLDREVATLLADRERLREALSTSHAAMAEYYRYFTGGETKGSYDGKPERSNLWKAMYAARAALVQP